MLKNANYGVLVMICVFYQLLMMTFMFIYFAFKFNLYLTTFIIKQVGKLLLIKCIPKHCLKLLLRNRYLKKGFKAFQNKTKTILSNNALSIT